MKKSFILTTITFLLGLTLSAQQEVILTKYTFNPMFFNPAYVGSNGLGEGSALLHYRNQWMGLEGAPTTIMAGVEKSMMDNRLGLGGSISRESIGVLSNTELQMSAAYRIQLRSGYISGGLRVSYMNFANDFTKLTIADAGDIFDMDDLATNTLSAGLGAYYHTEELYIGIAVPMLAQVTMTDEGGVEREPHYYMHLGMMIGDEYSSVKVEPSLLLKYQKAAPVQYTFGLNAWLNEDFAVGLHYRTEDALAVSAEFHFLENYRIAAAYDFTLSDLRDYTHGSLEILLGYRFNSQPNNPRVRNLRHRGRF